MLEILNTASVKTLNLVGQYRIGFVVAPDNPAIPFTVPPGVRSLSVVMIGGGGKSTYSGTAPNRNFTCGGGGGLSWRNDIPVTPGETLEIVQYENDLLYSSLKRGDETLVTVQSGNFYIGGLGGKAAGDMNHGGGNGGSGGAGRGGGGAGGYMGNGGMGADKAYGNGGTGGGGGGGCRARNSSGSALDYLGAGGGVQPYGQRENGGGGLWQANSAGLNLYHGQQGSSRQTPAGRTSFYGGGQMVINPSEPSGYIRIIWGADRYFPNTNTDDVLV